MTASIIILLVTVTLALVATIWRLASRRQSLPCPVWLRWLVELDNPFTKTNRAAFIVDTLAPAEGMTVLDAGCGPGRLTLPLARSVGPEGRVVALDIQPLKPGQRTIFSNISGNCSLVWIIVNVPW